MSPAHGAPAAGRLLPLAEGSWDGLVAQTLALQHRSGPEEGARCTDSEARVWSPAPGRVLSP